MRTALKLRIALVALITVSACAAPSPRGAKEVEFATGEGPEDKITEAQLQDSIFRFANLFSAQVREGLRNIENSTDPKARYQALSQGLRYMSSALDIALGPSPEANLLDMITFIELSRSVWGSYWIPEVFHEAGIPMAQMFEQGSERVWRLASGVLNDQQKKQLAALIRRWRQENMDQIAVENVRLSEFSQESGARARQMEEEVGGLLSAVDAATVVGDRALLFSERALFYAQRAPFLLRLQAQLGTREAVTEGMLALRSSQRVLEQEPRLRRILQDMNATLASLNQLFSQAAQSPEITRLANQMVARLAEVLQQWNSMLSTPPSRESVSRLARLTETVDARVNQYLWKFFGLGVALILFAGLVSLGSRLAHHRLVERREEKRASRPRRAA